MSKEPRRKLVWETTKNMFGHTYVLKGKESTYQVGENIESDLFAKHQKKTASKFFWFRAPKITENQLRETVEFLSNLDGNFVFDVYETGKELDASLKLTNDLDAANLAWSLTEAWMKWNQGDEDAWLEARKPVKLQIEKDEDGNVTVKANVTVKGLSS
jgi:hypothetical protein